MSIKVDELSILQQFIKIRRQLNLIATQVLKPLGIGPKQAVLLTELKKLKVAKLSELAKVTQTDPTATGKSLNTLIKKQWIKKIDDPHDQRCWKVSLNASGIKVTQQLNEFYEMMAAHFCKPLSLEEKILLNKQFTEISNFLETCLRKKRRSHDDSSRSAIECVLNSLSSPKS